jgi:hypothetical protein
MMGSNASTLTTDAEEANKAQQLIMNTNEPTMLEQSPLQRRLPIESEDDLIIIIICIIANYLLLLRGTTFNVV